MHACLSPHPPSTPPPSPHPLTPPAAASSPLGVVLGAVAGHGAATVVAVLGGSFLGRYLDERIVQYVGGSLFLLFAAATVFDIATGAQ